MLFAGRYRIVGPVGRGGMGEVYRADDLKLGQPVALKFLPEQLQDDPDRRERLFGEVRLARQVSHPAVCRMYDVGEADGQPFLSMEYVDGEDLASLLRRIGRLPRDKALEIARQLCAGLAAALDPAVERAILRCLEKDPRLRPASALAVAAALPGGDPLAAALAAGETPSPELVAAAGEAEGLSPAAAWTCLLVAALGIALFTLLSRPCSLLRLAPVDRSPAALEDRARDLVRTLAYDAKPADARVG